MRKLTLPRKTKSKYPKPIPKAVAKFVRGHVYRREWKEEIMRFTSKDIMYLSLSSKY
jgi:hypothetical protein